MKKKKAEKPPPEGAEVKIMGEGLTQMISGKELVKIVPLSGRYIKKPIQGYLEEPGRWPQKVIGVGVKGKLLFWIFENNSFLLNTLGMTGGWSPIKSKHARVEFEFDDGISIFYTDVRNFGTLKIVHGKKPFIDKLNSLGPDMLSENLTDEQFRDRLSQYPDATLPEVLMSQGVISGVGNYVKAESLYRAGLSPHRTVLSLKDEDYAALNRCIKEVLQSAYNDRGASIRDYQDVNGQKGTATLEFKVYGRDKDPLGNEILKIETKDGRVTHWCPAIQK